ncbi:MAG: hypothetical protein WBN88_18420, partial [Anderseniella sp.]
SIGLMEYFGGGFVHFGFVMEATGGDRGSGSNDARVYINGKRAWEGTMGTSSAAVTQSLAVTTDNANINSDWWGWLANFWISDNIITDEQFAVLSDESFGHASPYVTAV